MKDLQVNKNDSAATESNGLDIELVLGDYSAFPPSIISNYRRENNVYTRRTEQYQTQGGS